jgi:hypothetical protein
MEMDMDMFMEMDMDRDMDIDMNMNKYIDVKVDVAEGATRRCYPTPESAVWSNFPAGLTFVVPGVLRSLYPEVLPEGATRRCYPEEHSMAARYCY